MYGDFLPYIPGLLNWVLDMDEESATSIVKNYEVKVPSLLAMKARTLVETNPIADWLDSCIVYKPEAQTNVGVAKRDKDSNSPFWYLDTEKWLYPNYCEYCHNSGTRPVSLRRFVNLLSDLALNQLGLDISRERDRFGSYFVGLKIRTAEDSLPPLITGNTEVLKDTASHIAINININSQLGNTNVINKLWTMVIDKVMGVMDYVMIESIDSDGCDECDGKNEKSLKLETSLESKVDCNTKNKGDLDKKEISQEFLKMPSQSSHKQAKSHIKQGVPQGGICSPLLANIALHGMEERINEYAATCKGGKRDNIKAISLIRYADDFVILHENQSIISKCKELIEEWLSKYGLKLNQEKTQVKHTLIEHEGQKPGFDFLGFTIRQFRVGKYQSGKVNGKTMGFKTIIKPSDKAIKGHYEKIAEIIDRYKAAPQGALIGKLNPIIRGWSN